MATARMGRPSPPSPGTQGAISDGTQVHGRETPLHCSLLSFLIQNVCVSLVGFVKAILPPVGHTWSTGRDRQVLPGDHILLETGAVSVPLGPGAVGEPQTGGSGQGRSYRAVCKCGSPLVSEGPSEGRGGTSDSRCQGLCIFSSLPAFGFLHLCTQPLTPETLLLGHTVAHRQAPWTYFAGTLLQLRSLLPRLLVHRTGLLCHCFLP